MKGDVWPLLLGGAAFFYLWWLATLLFDLSFVWKRFVRHAAVTDAMCRMVTKGYETPCVNPPPVEESRAAGQLGGA